jgi:YggT family protein
VRFVADLVELYIIIVFARVLLSWFPITPGTGLARVARVLIGATDPLLRPIRRVVPPLRLGSAGIDLAPLILLIGLEIIHGFL